MSMYSDGIGADIGGSKAIEKTANYQLAAYNADLQKDLATVARSFPTAFVAADAEKLLNAAVDYGKRQLSSHKTLLDRLLAPAFGKSGPLSNIFGRPVNTHALELAIEAAQAGAKAWHGRTKETYVYNQGKNKEWQDLNTRVMTVYVECAGLIGEHVAVNAARAQLSADVNPVAPTNIAKYLLIGGAVFFGYRLITDISTRATRAKKEE